MHFDIPYLSTIISKEVAYWRFYEKEDEGDMSSVVKMRKDKRMWYKNIYLYILVNTQI